MHFSFWEKAGFAALTAAWVTWGSIQIGNALNHPEELAENAYKINVGEVAATTASDDEPKVEESAVALLASVDASGGEKVFKKCAACHGVDEGGGHKVGPNLWNIVGAQKAGKDGYAYSGALAALGGTWSYENLDAFLKKPRDYAPGNKMTFAGLKKASDRAKVILYLRDQSSNPLPLP